MLWSVLKTAERWENITEEKSFIDWKIEKKRVGKREKNESTRINCFAFFFSSDKNFITSVHLNKWISRAKKKK